jgi:hypothetical protein
MFLASPRPRIAFIFGSLYQVRIIFLSSLPYAHRILFTTELSAISARIVGESVQGVLLVRLNNFFVAGDGSCCPLRSCSMCEADLLTM